MTAADNIKRITLDLPVDLVEALDRVASREMLSRSDVLRRAARREVAFFCGREFRRGNESDTGTDHTDPQNPA